MPAKTVREVLEEFANDIAFSEQLLSCLCDQALSDLRRIVVPGEKPSRSAEYDVMTLIKIRNNGIKDGYIDGFNSCVRIVKEHFDAKEV